MKFIVFVQSAGPGEVEILYELEANSADIALQVAAARDRELKRMEKFMEKPV